MIRYRRYAAALVVALLVGCAGPLDEDGNPRKVRQEKPYEAPYTELALSLQSTEVRTVQLHRQGDEAVIPVAFLGEGDQLQLSFDLLGDRSRPFQVYFYHADRNWERDLIPAEYLTSFQRDEITEYQLSQGTEVRYVHYSYSFPNRDIGFEVSGNYILRVAEAGNEEDVLFERPFFVAERSVPVVLGIESVLLSGRGYRSDQPVAQLSLPASAQADVFNYGVCFVQNGVFSQARCSDRPFIAASPGWQFYLEPRAAFPPANALYQLNMARIQTGPEIEATNTVDSPYEVYLEPDYENFPDGDLGQLLNGQILVSDANTGTPTPDINADYALTYFRYVPLDGAVPGRVYVTGSFNGWSIDAEYELDWIAEDGWYQGAVLIKQGVYEYAYAASEAGIARRFRENGVPRFQNEYTALVYYEDVALGSDRLLAVQGAQTF
ncbi:MAG: type IX secretion system plug protein domain-containing protein [Bacteroidota bacterium]